MKIEVKPDTDYWSVFVNEVRIVDRESFSVAHRIAEAIRDPHVHPYSEAREVADAILNWAKQ